MLIENHINCPCANQMLSEINDFRFVGLLRFVGLTETCYASLHRAFEADAEDASIELDSGIDM